MRFFLMRFWIIFQQYIRMDHLTDQNYKNEHNEIKYLNNIPKNRILKAKNGLLELGKEFTELRDREIKIGKELEELFLNKLTYL